MVDPYPDGSYYGLGSVSWFEQELVDMERAGIDVVFPVSWGQQDCIPECNWCRWQRQDVALARLTQAIDNIGSDIQIAMFDDTTSYWEDWNKAMGRCQRDEMLYDFPLDNPAVRRWIYDSKIKPFFEDTPEALWFRIQGRPVIMTYLSVWFSNQQDLWDELWSEIKQWFEDDFLVEPFVILDKSWFSNAGIAAVADAKTTFGAALTGAANYSHLGYTVSSVGPGFDDRLLPWAKEVSCQTDDDCGGHLWNVCHAGYCHRYQPRYVDRDGHAGPRGDRFLRTEFARIDPNTDLLMLETWNELMETTGFCRAINYQINGQHYADDYFMRSARQLIIDM